MLETTASLGSEVPSCVTSQGLFFLDELKKKVEQGLNQRLKTTKASRDDLCERQKLFLEQVSLMLIGFPTTNLFNPGRGRACEERLHHPVCDGFRHFKLFSPIRYHTVKDRSL